MTKFYMIDVIDDEEYSPSHPETIKFFDCASAQHFFDMLQRLGPFNGLRVAEHEL